MKHELEEVENLIQHILSFKHRDDKILVLADDETSDDFVNAYADHSEVTFQRYTFQRSFAEMRNYGVSLCDSEWVFHVDADEIPHEFLTTHLHTLLEVMEDSQEVIRVPRINHLLNLTPAIIEEYQMESRLNDKHWFYWPDPQPRIHRTTRNVKWVDFGGLHETVEGYDWDSKHQYWLSSVEKQSIYHPKEATEWIRKEQYWKTNWPDAPQWGIQQSQSNLSHNPQQIREKIKELGPFFHRITVQGIDTQTRNNEPRDLWASIQHTFSEVKGKRVLDIGCNAGFMSFELAKAGAEVLGVDNNQAQEYEQQYSHTRSDGTVELRSFPDWITQAEWIESELNTGAKFQRSDFYDLDESDLYDSILFLGVYYHLPNPASALRKLNRLLKKGGELYLESETHPTESHYYEGEALEESMLKPAETYKGDPSVYLVPTPADINTALAHNGFKVVETFDTWNLAGPRYAVRAVKIGDRHSRALVED